MLHGSDGVTKRRNPKEEQAVCGRGRHVCVWIYPTFDRKRKFQYLHLEHDFTVSPVYYRSNHL